uniref:Uncharacterized protein n=1 Tax=Syphacia muris TaxID=451379 RepID=A0A0N5AJD2_9BILA
MGSHEREVRHLNLTFGSSHSAGFAYEKRPTWYTHSMLSLSNDASVTPYSLKV